MLSKRDIEKEIGNGINIFPLKLENFKENSVNLTIGQNAWTTGETAKVYWTDSGKFSVNENEKGKKGWMIKKGKSDN